MQSNGLRGLLTEYGEVMAVGRAALNRGMKDALARLAERLPAVLIDTLREQWDMLAKLDEQIAQIEQRLLAWMKQDRASKTIAQIPGVGLLTATAAVATMGDAKAFKSGREFCRLARVGARTGRHWRQGEIAGYQQARRYVFANITDPGRAQRAVPCEGAGGMG
jgi:transposase